MSTATNIVESTTRANPSWPRIAAAHLRNLAASPLLQKSGLSILDQAVVSGTSFVTSVLLGRYVLREELGVYYLALSVIFFARGIQEQLISAPYMIYCSRKQGEALAEYAGSALVHQSAMMLATAVMIAIALLFGFRSQGVEAACWLLVTAAPLLLIREFIRQFLFAHLELKGAIALDVASSGLQLAGLAWLAATNRLNVTTTLAVLAVASGGPAIVWLIVKQQPMLGNLAAAWRDFKQNWTFARWALASQLLACTTPYVMPWVVALTHGAAETGTLGACATLVGLSNTFLMGLCNFLSPRAARAFAEGGLSELRSVLKKTALLFLATLGVLSVGAFLFGEFVAIAVFGPQFSGTGLIIGVLSLSVLANSFGVTAGNGLWAMEFPRANFYADLCSLLIVVVATLALVPLWGPLGAALAMLAGTSSDAIVRLWILSRTMRRYTEDLSSA